jgi:hypothetical protein
VLGPLVAILMTTTTCNAPTAHWKSYSGLLLLTSLSQGLALIFLSSNACSSQGIDLNIGNNSTAAPFNSEGQLSTCKISSGGSLAATALCVWFLAAVFAAMGAKGDEDGIDEAAEDVEAAETKVIPQEEAEVEDKPKEEAEVEEQAQEVAEQAQEVEEQAQEVAEQAPEADIKSA